MFLISFCAGRYYQCVSVSMHLSPFDFARNRYDYRLSARFSVHVVRGPRLVVSIRDSIVRGSGGSFYFVSAVIFDEGQIAIRAYLRPPCRTIAEGWPLETGREWRVRRQGKLEVGQERLPFEWPPIPTYTYAATAPPRLVSSPVYTALFHRVLSPFAIRRPPSSVYFPNVRIASYPSRRLTSLSTTLSLDAQGDVVTFLISS